MTSSAPAYNTPPMAAMNAASANAMIRTEATLMPTARAALSESRTAMNSRPVRRLRSAQTNAMSAARMAKTNQQ